MEFYIYYGNSDFLIPTQEEVDKALAAPWGGYDAPAYRKDKIKLFAQGKKRANEEQCKALLWFDRCEQEANEAKKLHETFRASKYPIKNHYMDEDSAKTNMKIWREREAKAVEASLECGAMERYHAGAGYAECFAVYLVAEICPPIYAAASPFMRPFPYELLHED